MTAGVGGEQSQAGDAAVHVVDDDEEVRWAIETLLMSRGVAVATHGSGVALLEALPTLAADGVGCVLTDVRMADLDGLHLLQHLKEGGFPRPVIVMTAHGDVPTAVRVMKAGAFDFIEKPFDDEELLAIIGAALGSRQAAGTPGKAANTASLISRNLQVHPRAAEAARQVAALSPREREVLALLMTGKPNKLVAHDLGISQRTVEAHRERVMTRLGVASLAEAVRIAVWAEMADDPTADTQSTG